VLVGAGGLWRAQVNLGEIIAGDGRGSQSTTCFRRSLKVGCRLWIVIRNV
jgi:hypothetical protein